MDRFYKIVFVSFLLLALQTPALNIHIVAQAQEASQDGQDGEKGDKGLKGEDGGTGQDGQGGEPSTSEPAQDGDDGDSGDPGNAGENGGPEENGGDGGDGDNGGDAGDGEDGGNGDEGEDGENAGETSSGGQGDAEINTGDATSAGQINNTGNSNTINSCVQTDKSEGKGSKEKDEGEEECVSGGSGDTEIENNNTADVGNEADINANTGDNEASGNNGSSTIDTGDAVAILDLFNLINTNIIDSNGLFVLLSNLQEQILDMDLRDWMPYLKEYNPECGESCYSLHDLEILNQNLANITNNVNVTANTGGNEASDNSGEGNITTGDAYAAANVINIANTNIIDSNYLLFIANNFGNFFGDIVFPNASSFFTSMFSSPSQVYSEVEINNTNTASISNNVVSSAETGENQANGGNSIIQTGDANSAANVFNQANMNLFGGNSFVALIRVSGNWSGNVFGLPEGILWQQTPNGIMLYSDDMAFGEPAESLAQPDNQAGPPQSGEASLGGKGGKGSKEDHAELEIENNNNATITNNVQVFALTGDNEANGNGKGGKIETGNAQAIANVVNVANTNVIGANWLFAMFNILGDFNGNISFGRPNLWIGQRAEIPNDPALPGDPITYYLTIVNNGDIPAHNVTITSVFDHPLFAFGSSTHQHTSPNEQEFVWDIGTLNPGAGKEISFTGNIKSDIPFGTYAFSNTSSVQATESDDDAEDNRDVVELLVHNEEPASTGGGGGTSGGSGGSGGGSGSRNGDSSGSGQNASTANAAGESGSSNKPNLKVTKTYAHEGDVYPGNEVDYTVVITNDGGGSAYDAFLVDVLESEDGEVVHEEEWDLGEVFPDEEIVITYSVVFKSDAKPGLYYNKAWVDAENGLSNTATTSIQLQSAQKILLSVGEELSKIAGELNNIEGSVLAIAGEPEEEFEQLTSISESHEQEVTEERSPFLASLSGLLNGFGPWASALAAGSLLFLFFFLKRRRRESAQ